MPRIWLELKEVHTFIIVYDCEVGLGSMEIRWLHLGDLEFKFMMCFFGNTKGAWSPGYFFHQVESRFHAHELNRQPLHLVLGTPLSYGSFGSSRTFKFIM